MGGVASTIGKVVLGPVAHAVGGVIKHAAGEAGKAAVQAGANAITGNNNNAAAAPKALLAAPPGAAGAAAPKALLAAPPGHPDTKPQVVAPVDAGKKLTAGLQAIAAAKAKEESDENATATNFLKHSLDMLKAATLQQCNILIVTDNEHDEWWPKGQKPDQHLPGMPDIEVDVGGGKKRKYAVYCFETGSYIRRGKTTPDQWIKWGETKEQTDKATGWTHVWFNEPKPKKDPSDIDKLTAEHNKKAGTTGAAAGTKKPASSPGKKPAATKPAGKEESEGEEEKPEEEEGEEEEEE